MAVWYWKVAMHTWRLDLTSSGLGLCGWVRFFVYFLAFTSRNSKIMGLKRGFFMFYWVRYKDNGDCAG